MRRNQAAFSLTEEQRGELSGWAQSRTLPAGDVFRARLILAGRTLVLPEFGRGAGREQVHSATRSTPQCSCVDEKTAIQAVDLDPVLPLSPGRAETTRIRILPPRNAVVLCHLEVKTGQLQGMTAGRHTSREFITFPEGLAARTQRARKIHVVLYNLSAHKTKRCRALSVQPSTGAISSHADLLVIQRDVMRRGVFTSVCRSRHQTPQVYSHLLESAKPFRPFLPHPF